MGHAAASIASAIFSAVIKVGKVGVRARQHRKQRSIDDPQTGDVAHPTLSIGHRHRVVLRSHAARAGRVPHADCCFADKVFERLVVADQLVEAIAPGDNPFDQDAAQPGRAVEQTGDDVGD